ncbi:tail fiber assembly protein [Klebsiella aerogenes]|nr:tail fiber assembly protein [Klebsiella aerogenes]
MTKAELNDDMIAVVAGYITVHNFDGDTLEYTGVSNEYLAVGVGIPAYSSIDAPGEKKDGFAICRTADLKAWEYRVDHRGATVYSTETGEAFTIASIGEYPKNTTTLAPCTPYDAWNGREWVTDSKAQHVGEVEAAERQQEALISTAKSKISLWQTELLLGIITDDDKVSLMEWVTYIKELQAIDTSMPENIKWPEPPTKNS